MKETETLIQVNSLHNALNSIIGGAWGTDWTYQIHWLNNTVLLSFVARNKTGLLAMNVDVIGKNVSDALENALYLLTKQDECKKAQNTKPQQEEYIPTEHDLAEMDDYFRRYSAKYISNFSRHICQGYTKPYADLTRGERVRLCILWKNYMKNIGNE